MKNISTCASRDLLEVPTQMINPAIPMTEIIMLQHSLCKLNVQFHKRCFRAIWRTAYYTILFWLHFFPGLQKDFHKISIFFPQCFLSCSCQVCNATTYRFRDEVLCWHTVAETAKYHGRSLPASLSFSHTFNDLNLLFSLWRIEWRQHSNTIY